MSVEAGWQRGFPFHTLDRDQLTALIQPYAGGALVVDAAPLGGGLRNSNYRLQLSTEPRPLVLRIFSAEDPRGCCQREVALARLIQASVPVPTVLHSEPDAGPPWNLTTFVSGERLDDFLASAAPTEVEAASVSAGRTLAAIHAYQFPKPGWIGADLSIGPPPWPDITWAEMLTGWLRGKAGALLAPATRDSVLRLVDDNARRVTSLNAESRLVHADYKPWNLLVRNQHIAAVVDWEFAYSGTRMTDIGIYLRYSERYLPVYRDGFARGYLDAGGQLPPDWFELARLADLVNLCFFLEFRGSDPAIVRDVSPLIESTVTLCAR